MHSDLRVILVSVTSEATLGYVPRRGVVNTSRFTESAIWG